MKIMVDEMPRHKIACPFLRYDEEIQERVCWLDSRECDLIAGENKCKWLNEKEQQAMDKWNKTKI